MCEHKRQMVLNSRLLPEGRYRRRECLDCHHRWSTVEFEVDLEQGKAGGPITALRAKVGLTHRQQEALGELIDAFLEIE